MKRYLILGGSGFLGRRIVRRLARDNKVMVADILQSPDLEGIENVSFTKFDYLTAKSFAPLLEDVDTVIHLISTLFAKDGTENLTEEVSNNLFPTIQLLDDVVSKNINLLFVSSGGTVYGELGEKSAVEEDSNHPFCSYALTKIIIEQTLELYEHQHGLSYQIARLSNPYGYFNSYNRTQGLIPIIIEKILYNESITIWGDGNNVRDYIYIDDAVDAILSILEYKGTERVFNVGSGIGYSIWEIIDMILSKIPLASTPEIFHIQGRKCDLQKNILDIGRITTCTGWSPSTSLEKGISLVIEEFRKNRI